MSCKYTDPNGYGDRPALTEAEEAKARIERKRLIRRAMRELGKNVSVTFNGNHAILSLDDFEFLIVGLDGLERFTRDEVA